MKRRLVVRRAAEMDAAEAKAWYELQRPGLGNAFLEELTASLKLIESDPLIYPVVHGDYRRTLLRRFPYAVYYLVLPDKIRVVACLHGKRDPRLVKARLGAD